MKRALICASLVGLFGLYNNSAYSQCKTFTKKECMPLLSPYIHNGQMNNITLFPGEDASLIQTFYSGQDYRIQLCNQENLGDSVYFEIYTKDDQKVYTTRNEGTQTWDFNVANTQNLKIKVIVPEVNPVDDLEQNGCIAILVGFKDE